MKKKIFILSGIVVLLDQLVKYIVTNNVVAGGISVIDNFFDIVYVKNTGAAFSILTGSRWFLILIGLFAIYIVVKYFLLDINITKMEFVSYSLILGGIVGNLIDRIVHGYVIDYLAFTFGSYEFPVFNIADASIVIGASLVIIHLIINAIKQRRTNESNSSKRRKR